MHISEKICGGRNNTMKKENNVPKNQKKKNTSLMLSIIIVTMGEDEFLHTCLASIAEHVGTAHEVIVVNNSSDVLKIPEKPGRHIIENSRNLGFARAVNRGIEAAQGNMVLLLNPDAFFTSDITTPMISFLGAHTSAGIAGPQLLFPDGKLQNSIDIIPNLLTQILNKSLLKLIFPKAYPSKRSKFISPVRVPSIIGACMMIKPQVLDTVGLLDEGFFVYLEETDFCKRARDAGFDVWHLPNLSLVHHQGTTARSFDRARKIEFHRSMYRFFLKHRGPLQTALLYGLNIVKSLVETAGNLMLCLTEKGLNRLKKSASVLAWHVLGLPAGWGLEDRSCLYLKVKKNGYTWFLPEGADIPLQALNPRGFMENFSDTVVNRSRTSLVKSGLLDGKPIFLKRYNFKGVKDTLKNLFRKGRAQHSFEAALMLEKSGIDTPHVLFACEKRFCGLLMESYIATAEVNAEDLVSYVHKNGSDQELIKRLGRFVRRLHEMGILHVDFKGENVMIGHDGFLLIDLDRLIRTVYLSLNMAAKNISYLNASFAPDLSQEKQLTFLEEYLNGNTWFAGKRHELTEKINAYTKKRLAARYNK
jgi:GT2 family glycosyltransferase/tRNA A-37 threonylcarbamoyl transferase component Bud32